MRRVEPAFPDLLPVTHLVRPGYLPTDHVCMDPLGMGVVWSDAPRRTLPSMCNVPKSAIKALVFSRVARSRPETVQLLLQRGSSVLLVMDETETTPEDLGINLDDAEQNMTILVPILPKPLKNGVLTPNDSWQNITWGIALGLFPFPGAAEELKVNLKAAQSAGAEFAISAPLLLTPKDRRRILDDAEESADVDQLENALFHRDVSRGLHRLEREAGIAAFETGMDPIITSVVPAGVHASAMRTAMKLRLWARRLDQCQEESSWGWRLRRAATAIERLDTDPELLAKDDNLRVVPGFDPWVEEFTRAIWQGGDPVAKTWRLWSGQD